MTLGLAFWICMLIWLVFGIYTNRAAPLNAGGDILLFVILLLLGWHDFGPPIHS